MYGEVEVYKINLVIQLDAQAAFISGERAPSTHQTGSRVRLGVRLHAMEKRTISACGEIRTLVV
jgi:hypothetical protein